MCTVLSPSHAMMALHLMWQKKRCTGKRHTHTHTHTHAHLCKHQLTKSSCMLCLECPSDLHRSLWCWFPVDVCNEHGNWTVIWCTGKGVIKTGYAWNKCIQAGQGICHLFKRCGSFLLLQINRLYFFVPISEGFKKEVCSYNIRCLIDIAFLFSKHREFLAVDGNL